MDKFTFYNKIPEMECLAGDTLDTMEITVEGVENLTDPTMKVVISKRGQENKILVNKSCTATEDGFAVVIDSDDTESLNGAYWIDFILTADGFSYKRLRGCLIVHPQYKGV